MSQDISSSTLPVVSYMPRPIDSPYLALLIYRDAPISTKADLAAELN